MFSRGVFLEGGTKSFVWNERERQKLANIRMRFLGIYQRRYSDRSKLALTFRAPKNNHNLIAMHHNAFQKAKRNVENIFFVFLKAISGSTAQQN